MSYTEVWTIMLKRADGKVACDMHKCYGNKFWATEADAANALQLLSELDLPGINLADNYHVVPILCCTDEIWVHDYAVKRAKEKPPCPPT